MKTYVIRDIACSFDMRRTDMIIKSMANEGFVLVRTGSFGKLEFEYDPQAKKCEFFSYIKIDSQPMGRKMRAMEQELRRVYDAVDVLSVGSRMQIYRFDLSSKKIKLHLDEVAAKYGLHEFSHESYINKMRCERDRILIKNYTLLAVIFGIFAAFFGMCAVFVVLYALVPCAVAAGFCLYNIMKRILYVKTDTADNAQIRHR